MKKLLLFITTIAMLSCKSEHEKRIEETQAFIDDLKTQQLAEEKVDSLLKSNRKDFYLDTTGIKNSPVKIIKSELVPVTYTNKKNIKLVFKNTSEKPIKAIRFEWYGENAFNEPAEMGSYGTKGEGGGFTDDKLNAGKTDSAEWSIYSDDAKTIIAARPYEVAFSDGTIWKLRKD